MAFDQTTRNRLARFVSEARVLLAEEFTRQLQHEYGLDPASGAVTDLDRLTALDDTRRETALILRETMDYYLGGVQANGKSQQDVLDRIVREQAFTVLNRLCALRMAEGRGLLIESVGRGYHSKGFQLYARLAGPALGETGEAYRSYLFSLFDEFAVDLPVLFDRFSPQGRLFPREAALLKLLDLVNNPEIDPLWAEDETIGWIYQYFNSKEERKKMRAESQAPRNSRELAVRNQFFTPRYVVEFLTDNTLGRIWYEMTKGETQLKETCYYLVRRPNELFLDEGQEEPKQGQAEENLTQEELLKKPVYIPHRPMKDPREIKMLDPACGSMHFGLYAFDLFEQIYSEAWELEEELGADALWHYDDLDSLHDTYPDKETFLREVPRLIIERNIHGIDIDPRAVQIAGLSLWLRAQKSWQAQGLKPIERLHIHKSNIVCAEPMPGDWALLEEFLETLREDRLEALMRETMRLPNNQKIRVTKAMVDALANLVRTVWQEMKLAGEAGSLLKIEETLRDAIATARKKSEEKSPLFRVLEYGLNQSPKEQYTQLVAGEEQDFFDRAEGLVLAALRDYAEEAENGNTYRRRLFAGDSAKGFAFIDICRMLYDVVLMNPPFGNFSEESREYSAMHYVDCKEDIDAAFIRRASNILKGQGLLGTITNRTEFFKPTLCDWRNDIIFQQNKLRLLADLGQGILDDALVEAMTYVIEHNGANRDGLFFRLLKSPNRENDLLQGVSTVVNEGKLISEIYVKNPSSFELLPECRISYWASNSINKAFSNFDLLGENVAEIRQGLVTADDFRFLRLAWEVPISTKAIFENGFVSGWVPFAKGGEYAPYFGDIHLVVNWIDNGKEQRAFGLGRIQNEAFYFRPGLTWSVRTASGFSPRVLPSKCIFSHTGDIVWIGNDGKTLAVLSILMSRTIAYMIEMMVASGDAVTSGTAARSYEVGVIRSLPIPELSDNFINESASIVKDIWRLLSDLDSKIETSRYFVGPSLLLGSFDSSQSITELSESVLSHFEDQYLEILNKTALLEDMTQALYELDFQAVEEISDEFGPHPCKQNNSPIEIEQVKSFCDAYNWPIEKLISNLVKRSGGSRTVTKKCYFADRKLELLSVMFNRHPSQIILARSQYVPVPLEFVREQIKSLLSYLVGVCFYRWDELASNRINLTEWDPFRAIPAIPPALGASSSKNKSPILVDDIGKPLDIESEIRNSIALIWGEKAGDIEQEICEVLNIRSLRNYFSDPKSFFDEHVRSYSQSRRSAPIYWSLSTPSCSYTLWLYYHYLNDQTLYTCVNDFVDPKLKQVSEEASRLRIKKGRSASDEKELERLTDFERELKDFRAELLRVAAFWKPNLNDGVQITAAPLWKLFQHKPWQKKLKETWEKLEHGDYDWAHLAYSIWPARVREKCKTDKSLAIAHDLEHLYEELKAPLKKKKGKKQTEMELEDLFDED